MAYIILSDVRHDEDTLDYYYKQQWRGQKQTKQTKTNIITKLNKKVIIIT